MARELQLNKVTVPRKTKLRGFKVLEKHRTRVAGKAPSANDKKAKFTALLHKILANARTTQTRAVRQPFGVPS